LRAAFAYGLRRFGDDDSRRRGLQRPRPSRSRAEGQATKGLPFERAPRRSDGTIRDGTASARGITQFTLAEPSPDGQALEIVLKSGAGYRVPLDYICAWFPAEPPAAGARPCAVTVAGAPDVRPSIRKATIATFPTTLDLELSDGRSLTLVWETVLMACEPRYEHFGGESDESKELTKQYFDRYGSFRLKGR
jgi:hypothetical protein